VATGLSSTLGAMLAFRFFRRESDATFRDLVPGRAELRDYVGLALRVLGRRRRA
jgi:hypothetical protein